VGWCGRSVVFQPCGTGRLGSFGVNGNLFVNVVIV